MLTIAPSMRSLTGWLLVTGALLATGCSQAPTPAEGDIAYQVANIERDRVLRKAERYLTAPPRTVTAAHSKRSAGDPHDFYSEGDYWWPNPDDPDGPYIRRDGLTNPDNFIAHRQALMRFSDITASLTSAYLLTGDARYAEAAKAHLLAWFVHPDTRMSPHLLYAQAIKGRNSGRSIGVIDTIHLVQVARGAQHLIGREQLTGENRRAVEHWFSDYLTWLIEHPFGIKERQHPNNHGVCWAMQAAAFADLLGDEATLASIRDDFRHNFVGQMMATDGRFPAEMARTKPYGYSLFVLDAMAMVAEIASTPEDNLWQYRTENGKSMAQAMAFMAPYIGDKDRWPLEPDVLYWNEWPVRHPSLALAADALHKPTYLRLWASLDPDPREYEVRRNMPVRHPLLWLLAPGAAPDETQLPIISDENDYP